MDKNILNLRKRRLLEILVKSKILKDKRLYKAFSEVPLENFIPEKFLDPTKVYQDMPNVFYFDETNPRSYRTISAPHMICIMLQGLALEEDDDLLILGAKSGYIAALAHKLAPKGEIIILEANSEIAKFTTQNLEKMGLTNYITVIVKNPLFGMPELSPWQKILVTGAIYQSKIHSLLKQLDPNEGVLYAPIGEDFIQIYTQILRMKDEFYGKRQLQVRFTPLETQVELGEIELLTDFGEFEIKDDPNKVDKTLSEITDKINIKYTSNILEDIEIEPIIIDTNQIKVVLTELNAIEEIVKNLKKEEDIEEIFNFIDNVESKIENLRKYKKNFELKIKKMQNQLNQIRSYNIMRKELKKQEETGSTLIDKQLEIFLDPIK